MTQEECKVEIARIQGMCQSNGSVAQAINWQVVMQALLALLMKLLPDLIPTESEE